MDPIAVTQLVHDRTVDLQRTADGLRQERALRPASTPALSEASKADTGSSPGAQPVEVRRSPGMAGGCSPAEPAR
jgi:hypothetical protein